jgi:TM2 domain-containing membrane protein YozV
MKEKTVAALLALFLGGFGIHCFYLGKTAKGIIYLIFFWTFIPAIIAFFEAIIYFTMDQEIFDIKYNNKATQNQTINNKPTKVAEELEKLHALKEKGIITQAEFDAKKAKLL